MRKLSPIVLIIIIVGIITLVVNRPQPNTNKPTASDPITISAPEDKAIKGKTYTIRWVAGSGTTDIFLVNKALESEGVSVSLADRVYSVDNDGEYTYTFPKNIPDGEYRFQIGNEASGYFSVANK
jgi:hypothetical protein